MNLVRVSIDFYRRYLSRFLIFRLMQKFFLFFVKKIRKIESLLFQHSLSGSYTWISLRNFETEISRLTVIPLEQIDIPSPSFNGFGANQAIQRTPLREIFFPEISISSFKNAAVVGGIDFIFLDKKAIHHDLYLPEEHQCPAENIGVIDTHSNDKRFVDLWLTSAPLSIESGVSMIGQCSANYAHWLTETLPKLAILDSTDRFDNVPLLIDEGLHPNIMESLYLINRKKRPIIAVKKWSALQVSQLVAVSSPGYERYMAQGIRNEEPAPFVNKFSRSALKLLRNAVINSMNVENPQKIKRIYLARSKTSKNLRQILNINTIEQFLEEQHVHRVQSDELAFTEQVKACMHADLIVCPIGASLTNMIFAPPGCRIICLSPYYDEANYFYYANLAATLEHEICFVLGEQVASSNHPMHRNYTIDLNILAPHF